MPPLAGDPRAVLLARGVASQLGLADALAVNAPEEHPTISGFDATARASRRDMGASFQCQKSER